MKLLIAAHRADETEFYERYNQELGYSIDFWEKPLTLENVDRVRGCEAVAINAGCAVDRAMAQALRERGVRFLLTRTAGYDHLDVSALEEAGIAAAYQNQNGVLCAQLRCLYSPHHVTLTFTISGDEMTMTLSGLIADRIPFKSLKGVEI